MQNIIIVIETFINLHHIRILSVIVYKEIRNTIRFIMAEKYNASNIALEQILNYIKSGEIAIPEIQRPFVWKPKQVRDLIDSLYTGYPTGYLIISQSPNIRLKDGTLAEGKKIMIDGQQRVTALMTAIMGIDIINSDFQKKRIKIAFNPC